MDQRTLIAYDYDAHAFALDWEARPAAADMQALVRRFFKPGPTADIGCGSGRHTSWLNKVGLPTVGYDASEGLLAEARRLHPQIRFRRSVLPELHGIADASFVNVVCETVIMHLPTALIAPSVQKLVAILKPGGTLYLSWQVTGSADSRDEYGRLYTAFDAGSVLQALAPAEILFDEQGTSAASGKPLRQVVVRKANAAPR
jgi:SAM-dependent methyltransferase